MGAQAGQLCERARQWSSLRVDGELSELESALLDAHLRGCAACRTFARDMGGSTLALRSAPAVEQAGPITVSLGGRPWRERLAMQAVVLAAAIAASVVVGGLVGLRSLAAGTAASRPTAVVSSGDTANTFRELRREQLLLQAHPVGRNKLLPIGSV